LPHAIALTTAGVTDRKGHWILPIHYKKSLLEENG